MAYVKNGNWVRICKAFLADLPINRPFSEVEAIYSLQCSADPYNPQSASVAGLSKRWGWSRKKVRAFLDRVGVEIVYPKSTKKVQNQRGQIGVQITKKRGTDKGQKIFIDSGELGDARNRKGTDNQKTGDRSGATINKKKNKERKEKTFVGTSHEVRLSELLFSLMLQNNPKARKPNIQTWAKEIDKLIRIDKRDVQEIEQVIRWSQQDSFWLVNILSTGKLREKFNTLWLRIKGGANEKEEQAHKPFKFEDDD